MPFLGEVPLLLDIRETSDAGTPIIAAAPDSPAARAYAEIAGRLWSSLAARARPGRGSSRIRVGVIRSEEPAPALAGHDLADGRRVRVAPGDECRELPEILGAEHARGQHAKTHRVGTAPVVEAVDPSARDEQRLARTDRWARRRG